MSYRIPFTTLCTLATAYSVYAAGNGEEGNATKTAYGISAAVSSSQSATAAAILDELNKDLGRDYLIALAGFAVVLLVYRVVACVVQHTRTLACLNNDTQRYFAAPHEEWGKFKNHFLHAPLFRSRHNREWRCSLALNLGMLPTRFQSVFLASVVVANITLCVYGLPWYESETEVLPILRNRTGTISVVNLIPVMILSSPKNPLIKLLNVPYDAMNIMHRNFARLTIIEAVAHTVCWVIGTVKKSSWTAVGNALMGDNMIMAGAVATLAVFVISIQSASPIRHAFYEAFVHLHIALILITLVFLWMHLKGFSQQQYLLAAIITWAVMRFLRFYSVARSNIGQQRTKASVEVLSGDALRISVSAARKVHVQPGNHLYLYIPSVGLWTSHPFSIGWSDIESPQFRITSDSSYGDEKVLPTVPFSEQEGRQALSMVVRRRTGFTDLLYKKAEKAGAYNGVKLTLNAYVETGYGVNQSVLDSCGTVILFAGGVGITHQIPYVRHLVKGYAAGTVAARKVVLIWVTQSPEHLEWIRPWMTQILAMEKRRDVLMIKLFITRPKSAKEVTSPSATVQMFPGRPDIGYMVRREAETQIGCMGVSVCGPGSFSDDVRAAVRQQKTRNIEFVEESFSW